MLADNSVRVENWTETRISDLKTMWLEGKSASQIARQLGGTSRNAVIGKVHRMGLGGRDRPSAPRAVGRTHRRRVTGGQSNFVAGPRLPRPPGAPVLSRYTGPELTATATIMTLEAEQCRWPVGDPQEAAFGYCGRSRGRHGSYCDHHTSLALPERSPRRSAAGLARLFDQVAGQ